MAAGDTILTGTPDLWIAAACAPTSDFAAAHAPYICPSND
jgi:hypothetical protein